MSEDDLLDVSVNEEEKIRRRSVVSLVFLFLIFLSLVVAYFLSKDDIETIIATGAVLGLLSLTLFVLTLVLKRYYLLIPSLYGIVCVVSVFLFISLRELSPKEASGPVPQIILYMGIAYLGPLGFSLTKELRLKR